MHIKLRAAAHTFVFDGKLVQGYAYNESVPGPTIVAKKGDLVIVDVDTGLRPDNNTKRTILESFKTKDNFFVGLENQKNKDKLGINDSQTKEPILKFY